LIIKGSWLPCGRVAKPLISPLTPIPHDGREGKKRKRERKKEKEEIYFKKCVH